MNLKDKIRTVPHWPIEGVMFRDVTSLLLDPEAFRHACDCFVSRYEGQQIDKIVGIDARGFIFASVLAHRMNVGMVPVRKQGKLPADTISHDYTLEYGNNSLEIHIDAINAGDQVVIVDDLLATGGTASASAELVEKLGGDVVELGFVIELPDLNGRKKLNGHEVFSLIQFDGD